MEDIILEGTKELPAVSFHTDGKLSMEGHSYPEHADKFYMPMIKFLSELTCPDVVFSINIEYMNTSSIKFLLNMFRTIENNSHINTVLVRWHYDEDDDEILEQGEMFEEILDKCKFEFKENMLAA